jgi:hypothetical protein
MPILSDCLCSYTCVMHSLTASILGRGWPSTGVVHSLIASQCYVTPMSVLWASTAPTITAAILLLHTLFPCSLAHGVLEGPWPGGEV